VPGDQRRFERHEEKDQNGKSERAKKTRREEQKVRDVSSFKCESFSSVFEHMAVCV